MRFVKEITVLKDTYTVLEATLEQLYEMTNGDGTIIGFCDNEQKRIYIANCYDESIKRKILIHELTHMILNVTGLYAFNTYDEENVAVLFETYADIITELADTCYKNSELLA